MSKPPPRLLRSMPQAKQAAKAIRGVIRTSASASASGSGPVSKKTLEGSGRADKELAEELLALSIRRRDETDVKADKRAHGGRSDDTCTSKGDRSSVDTSANRNDTSSNTITDSQRIHSNPTYTSTRRLHPPRPRAQTSGPGAGSTSTVALRQHHTQSHAQHRRYNTVPTPPSNNHGTYPYIPNPSVKSTSSPNPNPSRFTFPFAPSDLGLNSKWFDPNPTSSSSTSSPRPPSPPSPTRTPSPTLDFDLPSSSTNTPFGRSTHDGPGMFTLATCVAVQHQGHVWSQTGVGSGLQSGGKVKIGLVGKGKGRAMDVEPNVLAGGKNRDFSSSGINNSTGILNGQEDSDKRGGLREGEKTVLEFRPGAYGIPKKRYASTSLGSGSHRSKLTSSTGGGPTHPHPTSTSLQIGEDAYYTHPLSLGIADGVGGWSSSRNAGVRSRADPGRFSLLLMGFCEEEVRGWEEGGEGWEVEGDELGFGSGSGIGTQAISKPAPAPPPPPASGQTWMFDPPPASSSSRDASTDSSNLEEGIVHERVRKDLCPVEVMQRGYEKCLASVKEEGLFGSATCLLAVLIDDELRVANLGDCAIVVIREGEIVFRTEEMQHSFNFPLQLGTNSRDEPMKDAQLFKVKVRKDDIVIMCSDGLVDNLFDEDILDIIASFAPPSSPSSSSSSSSTTSLPPFSPQLVSESLCRAAKSASEEPGSPSPFMCKALDEGIDFLGGKKDDISVLVAVVQRRERERGDVV